MNVPPLQTITFDSADNRLDPLRPIWQVTMNENGSLTVIPTGRRNGVILVEPQSNNCVVITTDKILK